MKKILFVHSSLVCGGVETALLDLCSLLNKEKYDVTVLEYAGWQNVLKPQFLNAGIRVITPYDKLVPGKNIIHKAYNVFSQKYIEHGIVKRNKLYINEEFDIIVYYQVTSLRVKCKSNPKILSYIHGDIKTNKPYCTHVLKHKETLSKSDAIICVSNLAKESFTEITGISKNVHVVFNPINSSKIYTFSAEPIHERIPRPYICAVGRLSPEKRFDGLVQIHRNLLNRGLLHDLVIVGEGEERTKIEETIAETNTSKSVHLVGFKENPYPYMKNSLFTVCSSYSEGLPVISMESLLLKKPIVSSFPTVGELFDKKTCGIITELSLKNLEEGIYKMLSDKFFCEECIKGAEIQSDFFKSSHMIKKVEAIFDNL